MRNDNVNACDPNDPTPACGRRMLAVFVGLGLAALTAQPALAAAGCTPTLRTMPAGDAASDAAGRGQMFESIEVPGITDVQLSTNSGVLADIDQDGRTDVLLIQSGGSVTKPEGKLRLLLNRGCFRFDEHAVDIQGAGFTAAQLGTQTQIANMADFNKDGRLDILLTRSRGPYDAPSIGNSLLVSDGAFDRFREVGARMGIANDQGYNRATAIGDLDGDGWLDFAVGADNIGNTRRYGIPRHGLFLYRPAASGRFEDGGFEDMSTKGLAPDFPGEFVCNARKDRAGPDILFRDLDGDGDLDVVQSYHVDMNGSRATDLCASGEYRTGVWVWKNTLKETGVFGFEKAVDNGLAEEGRAIFEPAKQLYRTEKAAMSLPYMFTADVDNDGRLDVLATGPTDASWTVKTDPTAARFWRNLGDFKFQEGLPASGLSALNWTYRQWAAFWGTDLPEKTQFDQMACKFNQLQVSICSKMTIGDYQFYHADALMEDFDNDGDVDILVADRREADGMWGLLRNVLLLGDGRGGFKPVATQISGIDRNSIAMETGDLNDDGLLDVVLLNSPFNSYPPNLPMVPPLPADRRLNSVYWNTGAHGGKANHWLRLRFEGVDHAALIGAQVELSRGDKLLGSRQLHTAQSYKSGGELAAHFGLGKARRGDVRVRLGTGEVKVFKNLAADAVYILDLKSGVARAQTSPGS